MKQQLLTVSAPPFWHSWHGVGRTSSLTIAALLPAVVAGIVHYGVGALAVLSLSVGVSMLTEALMQKILGRPVMLRDGTAALTGLLFAMLLPAGVPWWLVVVGAAAAMVLKQLYGGLGAFPFNAAIVAWLIMRISWAAFLNPERSLVDFGAAFHGLSPLTKMRGGYENLVSLENLGNIMMGNVTGVIGSAGLLLVIGGLVLALIGVIKWRVSIGYVVGAVVGVLLLGDGIFPASPHASISPVVYLFAAPFALGAFFLAPDSPSSPSRPLAMWIFGLGAGFLSVLVLVRSDYFDAGVPFGILLMSLTCPLLDKIRPRALGKE